MARNFIFEDAHAKPDIGVRIKQNSRVEFPFFQPLGIYLHNTHIEGAVFRLGLFNDGQRLLAAPGSVVGAGHIYAKRIEAGFLTRHCHGQFLGHAGRLAMGSEKFIKSMGRNGDKEGCKKKDGKSQGTILFLKFCEVTRSYIDGMDNGMKFFAHLLV